MSFNIAIDGPAGAGKSTIAKKIAAKKGYIYVDTGAMYRAMALYLIREQATPEQIDEKCEHVDITIGYENGEQVVYLNGENVNGYIRTEEVGRMASISSPNPNVRRKLTQLQQKLAADKDVVMDGRDIGTCVLPGAQVKVYLTADSHERALRRYRELTEKGETCDLATIEKDIIERDRQDMTREISPLKQAEDAVLLDSSHMTIDEVVDAVVSLCETCEKK
ncbi:MAG: (d)CMP kinase [Lachnospiraceae bacterium]|nr:(d)CMP kinase [Lachnospiraceae bacterium]